jgi:hypothetical protein
MLLAPRIDFFNLSYSSEIGFTSDEFNLTFKHWQKARTIFSQFYLCFLQNTNLFVFILTLRKRTKILTTINLINKNCRIFDLIFSLNCLN